MDEQLPAVMEAILLTGHGDQDRLVHAVDVPVPVPGPGEVLVRVRACGLNNTDINTRVGWYGAADRDGGGWSGLLQFPRIQGADVCGEVVAAGPDVEVSGFDGRRVLVDPWFLGGGDGAAGPEAGPKFLGSEVDGGFAQYCVAPAGNAHPVATDLSDAELATFPCAATTAEHLLSRARVGPDTVVVVTGASGGVGTSAIQLARARGADVIAVGSASKADRILELGAVAVVDRAAPDVAAQVSAASPTGTIDAIADVVGGPLSTALLPALRRGGHYATSGAVGGPIVELDLRQLYLNDWTMAGATVSPPGTFARVVAHIESGALRPILAATYPLAELVDAQRAFADRRHVGNIVVEVP